MKVFISWSGKQSQQIALALKDWLPSVIQALDPWVSSADIEKGEAWFSSINDSLVSSNGMGIFCLTSENLLAPWMAFEAGALAVRDRGRVATFLHGVRPDALKPPLGLFQATNSADKSDVYKLLESLNARLSQPLVEGRLKKAFESNWDSFEKELARIRDGTSKKAAEPDQQTLLHEILATVRRIEKDANWRPGGDDQQPGSEGGFPRGPIGPRNPDPFGLQANEFTSASLRNSFEQTDATTGRLQDLLSRTADIRVGDALRALRSVREDDDHIQTLNELLRLTPRENQGLQDSLKALSEGPVVKTSQRFAALVNKKGGLSKNEKQQLTKSHKSVGEKGKKT